MLKPRQRGEPPQPVPGKPRYWQRGGGGGGGGGGGCAMESTRSLARVIAGMRDEIRKLEAENRELRGDRGHRSPGEAAAASSAAAAAAAGGHRAAAAADENPYAHLRRNVSAPLLEGQYKESTAMTVRRYSISSNLSGVTMREGRADRARRSDSGWGRLQDEIQHRHGTFADPAGGEVGKITSRHSLQEYIHKNRAKVKTVTFLLPVDDIYTNRPALAKHQEEPKVTELASITETGS